MRAPHSRSRRPRVPARRVAAIAQPPYAPAARRILGQSLVEFAIILPLLLGIVGTTLDFARVYQVWMQLQAVSRDTAEFLATDSSIQTVDEAQTAADLRICTAMAGSATCPSYVRSLPVALTQTSPSQPIWSARVRAEYDFQTLFLWPIISGLTGAERWTIGTDVTYEILRRTE